MKKFSLIRKDDLISNNFERLLKLELEKNNFIYDEENPDIVIAIGGDGTFLRAVDRYIDQVEEVGFLAIHTGTLGFFSEYSVDEYELLVEDLINKTPTTFQKRLLEIDVYREKVEKYYAVNEARVENIIHTQIMQVAINQQHFETFRGTGLCVSTQLGSTAYNRSLGGAVISNELELLQLTEITGIHHRLFRSLRVPMILGDDTKISFESSDFDQAFLGWDTHTVDLKGTSKIECYLSTRCIKFLRYRPNNYLAKLTHLF